MGCCYCKKAYYLLEEETGVWKLPQNSKEKPTLWLRLPLITPHPEWRMRRDNMPKKIPFRVGFKGQCLITSLKGFLTLIQVCGPHPRLIHFKQSLRIYTQGDLLTYGPNDNKVIAIEKSRKSIMVFAVELRNRKMVMRRSTQFINLSKGRLECLAICPKQQFLVASIRNSQKHMESLLLIEIGELGELHLRNNLYFSVYAYIYPRIAHVIDFYGYMGRNLILCCASYEKQTQVDTFVYNTENSEFKHFGELSRKVTVDSPLCLEKANRCFFTCGKNGNLIAFKFLKD